MEITARLEDTTAGKAVVVNADTGRRLGSVVKLDPWMVVSGTSWKARIPGKVLGTAPTRKEAVAMITRYYARFL